MSLALYYSKFCTHCKELLLQLSRTQIKKDIHFICIDQRETNKDGSVHIILSNGQRLLLPPNITTVPAILLLHHGNRAITGISAILQYLKPSEQQVNDKATSFNGEPLAFSVSEMGNNLSDTYSYLDMSAEELSAKGNGGLRIMHNYMLLDQNQTIATPPDDYVPDKMGTIDMNKIMEKRATDIKEKSINI